MATQNAWNNTVPNSANTVNMTGTLNLNSAAVDNTTNIGNSTGVSALVMKSGTGASSWQPTTTGSLAIGTTNTGTLSLGNTTGATSIQFGTGSALTTFVDWTAWTPTISGGTVAGASTYTLQSGYYSRIGNILTLEFFVAVSAATGTGNLQIGGLPFAISAAANNYVAGACHPAGATLAWPVGATSAALYGTPGASVLLVNVSGTAIAGGPIQMVNAAFQVIGTITYRV